MGKLFPKTSESVFSRHNVGIQNILCNVTVLKVFDLRSTDSQPSVQSHVGLRAALTRVGRFGLKDRLLQG